MDVIWLAVSVTVLAGAQSDGTPDVNVVPSGHYQTYEECEAWKTDRYGHSWGAIDPVTEKPALAYYFDCAPRTRAELARTLEVFTKEPS